MCVGLCPDKAEGVLQKCAPFGSPGHAVGGEQRESLAQGQPVPLAALQQGLLLTVGQSAQRVSQRGADLSPSEGVLGVG
jgi:hypothetical protein